MKRLKYVLIGLLLLAVLFECYFYFDNGGNVIIYLQNQSGYKNENIDYTVSFNDSMLIDGIFTGNETAPIGPIVVEGFSRNTISVGSKEKNVNIVKRIGVLPVKWVIINFNSNNVEIATYMWPVRL